MSKSINSNDGLKEVSEREFKDKLKEYSSRVKKGKKVLIPNEPVGTINNPRPTSEL